MPPRYSLITTCKGRLHHLRRSLPAMAAQPNAEVIVVDYDCPDETWRWVEGTFPAVKVVRVTGIAGFNVADARNRGAKLAQGERLVFIDADVIIAEHFIAGVDRNLPKAAFGHFGSDRPSVYGTCVVAKKDFDLVGGYDDVFSEYGGEDDELYARLMVGARLQPFLLPKHLISEAIEHSDAERIRFHDRPVRASLLIAMLYRLLKLSALVPLQREGRKRLYEMCIREVDRAEKEGLEELEVKIGLPVANAGVLADEWEIGRLIVARAKRKHSAGVRP